MSEYKTFHKTVIGKNGKEVIRWYYTYTDASGKRKQAACKKCRIKAEAEAYIAKLDPVRFDSVGISTITKEMFVPGSTHYEHRKQLGKSVKTITITTKRRYVESIGNEFGTIDIRDLSIQDVVNWLKNQKRSGSWKNGYLETLAEVYAWAQWRKIQVITPDFPRFARNSKKADILFTDEIEKLFKPEVFETEAFYIMFLVSLSGGMRLGEARGFRACQFIEKKQAIVIDGFLDEKQKRHAYNKKGSEENPRLRVAMLPKITCTILAAYITRSKRLPSDLLFLYDTAPIRKEYAEVVFERALVKAKIKIKKDRTKNLPEDSDALEKNAPSTRKLTPHSLRYTYVTRMRRGLDGEIVRKMAGHTSIEMTDEYTRAALSESIEALQPAIAEADRFFV